MNLIFRKATTSDIASIVYLLANDKLGALREDINDLSKYNQAFEKIYQDESQELIVVENDQGEIRRNHWNTSVKFYSVPHLPRRYSGAN